MKLYLKLNIYNRFTYEIAPVFILMEQVTLKKMRDVIGWSEGDSILGPGTISDSLISLISLSMRTNFLNIAILNAIVDINIRFCVPQHCILY